MQRNKPRKWKRSGLQRFFAAIEIVVEKDAKTYAGLVDQHRIVKSHGWMVGNSPRSDINPALQAGIERGIYSTSFDMGVGARGVAKRRGTIAGDFTFPAIARAFLEAGQI